jgi:hypothetical protein
MAVEVIKDEKKTLVIGKGVEEYYPKSILKVDYKEEYSEEVLEIVRGTSMYKNCQKS